MTRQPSPAATHDTSTPILALRRTFGELQHTVLAVARSAGRFGVPVYAVRRNAGEVATHSRYLRGVLPAPRGESAEQWLETLLEFGLTHGRPVLLTLDDDSAAFADEHHAALSTAFRMAGDPAGLHRQLASKRELGQLCTQLDLPAPKSCFPNSEHEAVAFADRNGCPVVLKRSEHWRPASDPQAPSVLIARTTDELLRGYRRMQSPGHPNLVIQEYIPGCPDAVWMFNGYFDRNGECLCAFTGQKLRQRGEGTGPTTLGICVWNQAVADVATRLMRGVGYQGIVDMGVRYDERDGQYKVLDVNPRLGSSFRLFVSDDGLDVVRAAYLDLTEQPVPRTRTGAGRKWMVEPYDLVASAAEIRAGTLTASGWARSFSGVEEVAWWARDDPLPFYAMCATLGWHAVGYRSRRRTRRRANVEAGTGRAIERGRSPQGAVDRYFDGSADYWLDIYRQDGLQGVIYRERMEAALRWIGDVRPPAGARVLEVGCGAGLAAAELGRSGFEVTATDSSIEMVKKAQRHAHEAEVVDAVHVVHADAHCLPFAAEQFDVVLALGLLPWLHDPQHAVNEMIRLLSPGGWIVVTADNRARLNLIVEPRENPLLTPVKLTRRGIKRAAGRERDGATSRLYLPGQVELMLRSAGAVPVLRTTVGFGPFTFLGRSLFNDATGLRLHRWLEHASEHRMPAARRLGWHYLVAAQKPER